MLFHVLWPTRPCQVVTRCRRLRVPRPDWPLHVPPPDWPLHAPPPIDQRLSLRTALQSCLELSLLIWTQLPSRCHCLVEQDLVLAPLSISTPALKSSRLVNHQLSAHQASQSSASPLPAGKPRAAVKAAASKFNQKKWCNLFLLTVCFIVPCYTFSPSWKVLILWCGFASAIHIISCF